MGRLIGRWTFRLQRNLLFPTLTLNLEAIFSTEAPVNIYQTAERHFRGSGNFHGHRRENSHKLKSPKSLELCVKCEIFGARINLFSSTRYNH